MNELKNIRLRNARVEADKAWEISWTRRAIIALATYIIIGAYLIFLDVENAWFHAVVPALAYFLSTLGLGVIKNIWIDKIYKNEDTK